MSDSGVNKGGRPLDINDAIVRLICEHIAMGISVTKICKMPGMPSKNAFYMWLRKGMDEDEENPVYQKFYDLYLKAKTVGTHALVDDVVDIADDESFDVPRARLKVESRLKYAEKVNRKEFGNSTQLTGNDGVSAPRIFLGGISGNPITSE